MTKCETDGELTKESWDFTDGCKAYAQYMLFHRLNQIRLAMKIVSPLSLHVEMQGSLESESLKDNLLLGLPDNNWGFSLYGPASFSKRRESPRALGTHRDS